MTHDTTPVVGDEWEKDDTPLVLSPIKIIAVSEVVTAVLGNNAKVTWTFENWHAWAANARRVG